MAVREDDGAADVRDRDERAVDWAVRVELDEVGVRDAGDRGAGGTSRGRSDIGASMRHPENKESFEAFAETSTIFCSAPDDMTSAVWRSEEGASFVR